VRKFNTTIKNTRVYLIENCLSEFTVIDLCADRNILDNRRKSSSV